MVKKNKNIIIAGPCAIESKSQFYDIVTKIYSQTDVIRAGVWKARTSPYDYAGVGAKALPWIRDVQKKYRTPVAIEIGTKEHVELALKYDVKIFWLGARTTVNPFAVEELAKAMRGKNIEVWIKNPIIADVQLWTGAIERVLNSGMKNIKLIHRGFYSEKKIAYRNDPKWGLLQNFKKKI